MSNTTCTIEGCDRPHIARGMCGKHYQRWSKYGDPHFVKQNKGNQKPRILPAIRTCRHCGFVGERDLFAPKRNVCKPCAARLKTEWHRANPDKIAMYKERHRGKNLERERIRRATRKGIDPALVDAYAADHDGLCDICKGEPTSRGLYIDHDHKSGAFRGLLCTRCNSGLGHFKDDPARLLSAIAYLKAS